MQDQLEMPSVVHVVDDDPGVLESLGWLFRSLDIPFRTYADAQEFLVKYEPGSPGCLILDVRMPGMSGLELQEHLQASGITLPIVFISGHGDVPVAVRAMKHGAIEFLQKPFDQEGLCEAVGRAFALDRQRRAAAGAEGEVAERLNTLSEREREILRLLIRGESAKEIGRELGISPRTVEFHRGNILTKMNARSLVSLALLIGRHLDGGDPPQSQD